MKRIVFIVVLLVGFWACSNKSEVLLQNEVKIFESGRKEFSLPESTAGSVYMEVFIESGFSGVLLLQNQDENGFRYKLYTHKGLYPLKNNIGKWQSVSLNWNLENSSLSILINDKVQTIRLIESHEIESINQFAIRSFKKSIKARNIIYKGGLKDLPERLKIVAFGNSTTAYRNTITGVYSQRLPKLLLEKGIPNIVFNEGVGGSHTGYLIDNNRHKVEHALDRFEKSVLEKSPDIVILCFGINDSWHDSDNGESRIPLEDYERNLCFMIEKIQSGGGQVIILTPNAFGNKFEKWRYDYTEKYVEVVRKLSLQYKLPIIDQWKAFEDYAAKGNNTGDLLLDGMHPNDIWHEQLANELAETIKTILND